MYNCVAIFLTLRSRSLLRSQSVKKMRLVLQEFEKSKLGPRITYICVVG